MPKIDEIEQYIFDFQNSFALGLEPFQKKQFAKVNEILRGLDIDKDGNIKQTAGNIKALKQIEKTLNEINKDKRYQAQIANINFQISQVVKMQQDFLRDIGEVKPLSPFTKELIDNSFTDVKKALTGAGLQANYVNGAIKIVKAGITGNQSIYEMSNEMQEYILGNKKIDSKMVSYSKQIVGDTLFGVSRAVTADNDTGSGWYQYVGTLIPNSRPFCVALRKKQWIHESEIPSILNGNIDGKKVSLQGLYPDTNANNFQLVCGGYNCNHRLISMGKDFIPKRILNKHK